MLTTRPHENLARFYKILAADVCLFVCLLVCLFVVCLFAGCVFVCLFVCLIPSSFIPVNLVNDFLQAPPCKPAHRQALLSVEPTNLLFLVFGSVLCLCVLWWFVLRAVFCTCGGFSFVLVWCCLSVLFVVCVFDSIVHVISVFKLVHICRLLSV